MNYHEKRALQAEKRALQAIELIKLGNIIQDYEDFLPLRKLCLNGNTKKIVKEFIHFKENIRDFIVKGK